MQSRSKKYTILTSLSDKF